jgi:hypothetical protein
MAATKNIMNRGSCTSNVLLSKAKKQVCGKSTTITVKWPLQALYNADGQKSGVWIEYFENGQIEVTGAYNEQGKKTGLWEEFYENGLPASKGMYENDVKIGKWMNWDADGKKTKTSY